MCFLCFMSFCVFFFIAILFNRFVFYVFLCFFLSNLPRLFVRFVVTLCWREKNTKTYYHMLCFCVFLFKVLLTFPAMCFLCFCVFFLFKLLSCYFWIFYFCHVFCSPWSSILSFFIFFKLSFFWHLFYVLLPFLFYFLFSFSQPFFMLILFCFFLLMDNLVVLALSPFCFQNCALSYLVFVSLYAAFCFVIRWSSCFLSQHVVPSLPSESNQTRLWKWVPHSIFLAIQQNVQSTI